jgi:TRAP-type mannitol/chloroaromatic compound transport system permease large subunit
MAHFLAENMAPIMFASLLVFLLIGYPVAFSLAAVGLTYALIGMELGLFSQTFLQALPERVFGIMRNETLLAIPFFTFMGLILERSGMAEDLLDTIGQLFGPIRGGLGYAVVFVGALLAATTGVVAASVISMGLISLPIMLRYGYDRRVASGVIAASGTLAQIIPPSLVLIVMADQLGRSVGDMYKGAMVPGLMLGGAYMFYVFIVSMLSPKSAPALPAEARKLKEPNGSSGVISVAVIFAVVLALSMGVYYGLKASDPQHSESNAGILAITFAFCFAYAIALANRYLKLNLLSRLAEAVVIVLVPPLGLIFLVLGTIYLGIATPTEGGAMGAVGALIMAMARGKLPISLLTQAVDSTAKLSAFVMFILLGATVFSLTFIGTNGHHWVEHLLTSTPGGVIGFLIVVNLLIFFLAFFLDYFELAFIVVPLLVPAANALGIDLVWFGVMLAVNMQTSFMHPPFGFALFFLRSVAPKNAYNDRITGARIEGVKSSDIYWGALPFVLIQIVMIGLVIAFPGLVMHYKGTPPAMAPQDIQMPTFGGTSGPGVPSFDLPPPAIN